MFKVFAALSGLAAPLDSIEHSREIAAARDLVAHAARSTALRPAHATRIPGPVDRACRHLLGERVLRRQDTVQRTRPEALVEGIRRQD